MGLRYPRRMCRFVLLSGENIVRRRASFTDFQQYEHKSTDQVTRPANFKKKESLIVEQPRIINTLSDCAMAPGQGSLRGETDLLGATS